MHTWALRMPWWQITTISASGSNSVSRAGTLLIGTLTEPSIWHNANSHGSRTSSSTGRAASAALRRAASSVACKVFIEFLIASLESDYKVRSIPDPCASADSAQTPQRGHLTRAGGMKKILRIVGTTMTRLGVESTHHFQPCRRNPL